MLLSFSYQLHGQTQSAIEVETQALQLWIFSEPVWEALSVNHLDGSRTWSKRASIDRAACHNSGSFTPLAWFSMLVLLAVRLTSGVRTPACHNKGPVRTARPPPS